MYALTTKARIKERLDITASNFDDLLDRLILAVTDRIERYCNRRFMQATYTNELYDGCSTSGGSRSALIVKNAPILVLSSIQYKSGSNENPVWTSYDEDDYDVDMNLGIVYFKGSIPKGRQNIRITYTGGYSGYSIGVNNFWVYNSVPTGAVNGVNLTYTIGADASEIIVYADGLRISADNYTFVAGTDDLVFDAGQAPFSTLVVDYLPTAAGDDGSDPTLPLEVVEVCEEAVVRLYKRRHAEGRSSETIGESTVTYATEILTKENIAVIKNFRRSSFL
jgi:hypothetical protein